MAVQFAMDLRSNTRYWRHQELSSIDRTEDDSIPAPIPPHEQSSFDDTMQQTQSFFNFVAAQPPPPTPSVRPKGFTCDDSGAVMLRWRTYPPMSEVCRPSSIRRTFSTNNNQLLLWRATVLEVAAGWLAPMHLNDIAAAGYIFIGPKDRFLYDPREVNSFLDDVPLSYPRASDFLHNSSTFCAVKGDIKGAFRHVRVAKCDQQYLGVVLDNFAFTYTVLPFGLSQSPVIFARSLQHTFDSILPSLRPCLPVIYVDDAGVPGPSPLIALRAGATLARGLYNAGWNLAVSKWYMRPAQQFVFVGLIVDFINKQVRIREAKALTALSWIAIARAIWPSDSETHLDGKYLSHARDYLRRGLGILAWFATALPFLNAFRRSLDEAWTTSTWSSEADISAQWFIEILEDIHHWSTPPRPRRPLYIVTDASATGWGALIRDHSGEYLTIAGTLSEDQQTWGSAPRELLVVVEAVTAARKRGIVFDGIHVDTDAQAAAAQLTRWSTRSAHPQTLHTLAQWFVEGMHISVAWHPRTAPSALVADALSGAIATAEWSLTQEAAALIWDISGGWTLDLYASETRRWAEDYCAQSASDHDRATILRKIYSHRIGTGFLGDAGSMDLSGLSALAFPPWSQVPTVADRINNDNTKQNDT